MGALTVEQLLVLGLQELGVGAAGEPIEPEDLASAQTRFNMVIDSWKAQRLMIHKVLRELFAVTSNTVSYTIGPSGVWNTPTMPLAIVRAGFVNTAVNPSTPLETPMHVYTDEEWASIGLKSMTSTISWGVWYRTDFTTNAGTPPSGTGTVFIYPICTMNARVALYLPVPIDEVADDETGLLTTIVVPPGYRKAIVTSIAMECADLFEIDPSPRLVSKWTLAMKVVKRSNSKPATLKLPRALTRRGRGGGYNILSNQ